MPMMKCGHSSNGAVKADTKEPVCVICYGILPGAEVVVSDPDLTGRVAKCRYGDHGKTESNASLPFFGHRPDKEYDEYYCGCYGWD